MHRPGSGYAWAFNDRWAHSGHLFQGRFHSVLVDSDRQLLTVLRYIHLNPCRTGLVTHPAHHPWSSHRAYLGESAPRWLCTARILAVLGATEADAQTGYAQLLNEATDEEAIRPCVLDAETGAVETRRHVHLDRILDEVARRTGCTVEEIRGPGTGRSASLARFAVVLAARTTTGTTYSELARVLGRDAATLCNGLARHMQRNSAEWRELTEGVRRCFSSEKEMEMPDPL